MSELSKLWHQQAQIVGLLLRFEGLILQARPPRQLHLLSLRHELSVILVAHLNAADRLLYPRLLASDDPEIAAIACSFRDHMGGLAELYADYCRQWDAQAMAGSWAAFCAESRKLIAAVTARISLERRELFPQLERYDWAA